MLLRRKEYMKHHDDAFGHIYYFITNELVGYTRSTFQIVFSKICRTARLASRQVL